MSNGNSDIPHMSATIAESCAEINHICNIGVKDVLRTYYTVHGNLSKWSSATVMGAEKANQIQKLNFEIDGLIKSTDELLKILSEYSDEQLSIYRKYSQQ